MKEFNAGEKCYSELQIDLLFCRKNGMFFFKSRKYDVKKLKTEKIFKKSNFFSFQKSNFFMSFDICPTFSILIFPMGIYSYVIKNFFFTNNFRKIRKFYNLTRRSVQKTHFNDNYKKK